MVSTFLDFRKTNLNKGALLSFHPSAFLLPSFFITKDWKTTAAGAFLKGLPTGFGASRFLAITLFLSVSTSDCNHCIRSFSWSMRSHQNFWNFQMSSLLFFEIWVTNKGGHLECYHWYREINSNQTLKLIVIIAQKFLAKQLKTHQAHKCLDKRTIINASNGFCLSMRYSCGICAPKAANVEKLKVIICFLIRTKLSQWQLIGTCMKITDFSLLWMYVYFGPIYSCVAVVAFIVMLLLMENYSRMCGRRSIPL